jgi:hypothetical protein
MTEQRYHLARINAEADLVALIGKDTPLRRKGNGPYGVEYSGPCPICHQADHDGLVVQPENKPRPTWFCRRHTGPAARSAFDYLAERRGYDLEHLTGEQVSEIARALAGDTAPTITGHVLPGEREAQPARLPPAQVWQTTAAAYIQFTERNLWGEAGAQALEYLRKERGLQDGTIKAARLGYNPTGLHRPAEKWGNPNGSAEPVYLWPGITIPWIVGGEIWAINTRRPDAKPEDRYRKVKGSRAAIYNADRLSTTSVALYVEGELDAILAQQEAGNRLAVVSLGSGSGLPDEAVWAYHFYKPNLTLFLPDNDEAGWATAEKFARANLARFLALVGLPTNHKDLGDFYRAGGNVGEWITDILQAHDPLYADISALAVELGATVTEL